MGWLRSRGERETGNDRYTPDEVTGLMSRPGLLARAQSAVAAIPSGGRPALIVVEVDGVDTVRDGVGLAEADELVRVLATRCAREVGDRPCVARIGDQQFAILYEDDHDPGSVIDTAYRLRAALAAPVTLTSQHQVLPSSSCGVVAGETVAAMVDADTFLRGAYLALRDARRAGHNQIEVCSREMIAVDDDRRIIGRDLRDALAGHGLDVCYQPIVDLRTRATIGFEALVRWSHPVHGQVSPDRFVPLAEEFGLISDLGRAVLSTAAAQVQQWSTTFGRAFDLHVNVSGIDLTSPGYVEGVTQCLAGSALPPAQLVLEVTESTVLPELENVQRRISALHEIGVRVAMDDYATSRTAPAYLQALDVDIVKVQRALIEPGASWRTDHLLAGVVSMAAGMGVHVYGEGIEDELQRERLVRHGCRVGQGYLFSEPLRPEAATAHLRSEQLSADDGSPVAARPTV